MSDATTKSTVKAKKVSKPKKESTHPPVAIMVVAAIKDLKDRKGSSLAAIKKYISSNYKVDDVAKLAPFIRKFLRKAVTDGKLTQVKGTGAAGSFKMSAAAKEEKPKKPAAKKPAAKKPAGEKKAKKTAPKKTKSPKKATKPKKAKTPKKAEKPKKAKTPKKTAKPKTKTPKKTTKKPAAKKVAKK